MKDLPRSGAPVVHNRARILRAVRANPKKKKSEEEEEPQEKVRTNPKEKKSEEEKES